MDTNQPIDITLYISIISSSLLAISEILPYIKSIKSNGILESITILLKTLGNNNYIQIPENLDPNFNSVTLHNSLSELLHEIRSYKQILQSYLNDKKINISIT